jgi:release factor glutamine methyltransferase
VLIPRRDTETLIETAVRLAPGARRFADIGTGSGAIALALLKELPEATAVAVDASEDALAVARANAERHGLAARLQLVRGDLVAPLDGGYDLVVSNPPYVPRGRSRRAGPRGAARAGLGPRRRRRRARRGCAG